MRILFPLICIHSRTHHPMESKSGPYKMPITSVPEGLEDQKWEGGCQLCIAFSYCREQGELKWWQLACALMDIPDAPSVSVWKNNKSKSASLVCYLKNNLFPGESKWIKGEYQVCCWSAHMAERRGKRKLLLKVMMRWKHEIKSRGPRPASSTFISHTHTENLDINTHISQHWP